MQRERPQPRRVSRRKVLLGFGAAMGAAAASGAACFGGGSSPARNPTPAPTSSTTTGQQTPGRPTVAPGDPGRRGGTLRLTGLLFGDGQPDPHKTQSGSFYGHLSLLYSRLITYRNQATGELTTDLATSLPQQPDANTLIFELNPAARWPEGEPFNGRQVTAHDVQLSIERQIFGDASFVHKARWQQIESIRATDDHHITITLKEPYAPIHNLFADISGFILPAEAIDGTVPLSTSSQPGSGPFRWVEWNEGRFASVARNPTWHAGGDRPFLDGLAITQPRDATEIEAKLRIKEFDVAVVGRPAADALARDISGLQESTFGSAQWFGMRFYIPIAPYNDVRLRNAITYALDRREMLRLFFAGSGELNPWISWPVTRWTLPQSELAELPGYRQGQAGREQDIREARALLAASLADRPLPGELELLVPSDTENTINMGSILRNQLKQNLDLNINANPQPINTIIQRIREGTAPWAAGPDTGWLDLDDWLYPYFHVDGPKNSFPLRDDEINSAIVSQRRELDPAYRREIGFSIQRKLLTINAGVNLVSERVVTLAWPYVHGLPFDISDGYQARYAEAWLDKTDENFRGR